MNSKDEPSSGWIAPNRYNDKTKDTEFPYVHQSGGTLSAEARDADGRSLGNLSLFPSAMGEPDGRERRDR